MRLEITMVAGSGVFAPVELSVTWPPGALCSGLSLQQALERQWPGFVFTVAGQSLGILQPASAMLCNGAVVVACRRTESLLAMCQLRLTHQGLSCPALSQQALYRPDPYRLELYRPDLHRPDAWRCWLFVRVLPPGRSLPCVVGVTVWAAGGAGCSYQTLHCPDITAH
ncbi:hypothetical protein NHF46_15950 [Arthrobacter alpinus]|nr:hypothetical protein [Arthrobacter alpinus]